MPPIAFSPLVMEHFYHPRNVGKLDAPCGEGVAGSARQGQFVRIQVRVVDGRVVESRFKTFGCVPAIACGSYLTEWATGRPVEEVAALQPGNVIQLLELPPDRHFCARLAVTAMLTAVASAIKSREEDRKDG